MIAIVNTGGANLASISHALDRLGGAWTITTDSGVIAAADRVILPGVGSARDAMPRIIQLGLLNTLRSLTRPVLGICLGMQLLYEFSQEGNIGCLGVISGRITMMKSHPGITIPHMGWNRLIIDKERPSPLLDSIADGCACYFVHSYRAEAGQQVNASVSHGEMIPAVVSYNNFHGVQFHPERSGMVGATILRNFLNL